MDKEECQGVIDDVMIKFKIIDYSINLFHNKLEVLISRYDFNKVNLVKLINRIAIHTYLTINDISVVKYEDQREFTLSPEKINTQTIERLKNKKFKEELAVLCHQRWAKWVKFLYSKFRDGHSLIAEDFVCDWRNKADTSYLKLPGIEQDVFKNEADKFLNLIFNKKGE